MKGYVFIHSKRVVFHGLCVRKEAENVHLTYLWGLCNVISSVRQQLLFISLLMHGDVIGGSATVALMCGVKRTSDIIDRVLIQLAFQVLRDLKSSMMSLVHFTSYINQLRRVGCKG